jgi:hypothetical protein
MDTGTTSSVGDGFVCIAEVASAFPMMESIIVNAPSVRKDSEKIAAQDFGLESVQVHR